MGLPFYKERGSSQTKGMNLQRPSASHRLRSSPQCCRIRPIAIYCRTWEVRKRHAASITLSMSLPTLFLLNENNHTCYDSGRDIGYYAVVSILKGGRTERSRGANRAAKPLDGQEGDSDAQVLYPDHMSRKQVISYHVRDKVDHRATFRRWRLFRWDRRS